jgi:hypothetical protein
VSGSEDDAQSRYLTSLARKHLTDGLASIESQGDNKQNLK